MVTYVTFIIAAYVTLQLIYDTNVNVYVTLQDIYNRFTYVTSSHIYYRYMYTYICM